MGSAKTNERSMIEARDRGWLVWRVERTLPHCFIKVDLFHCFDSIALPPGGGILGIQSCGEDVQPHIRKLTEDEKVMPLHRAWLAEGGKSQLWAWRKRKFKLKSGKWSKAKRWRLKKYVFELAPGGVFYEELVDV